MMQSTDRDANKLDFRKTLLSCSACIALGYLLTASLSAAAVQLEGLVINETTGKHQDGDDIVLLSLSQEGMRETARTRTDDKGRFFFSVSDRQLTHVVRALHRGVTYHQLVEPGTQRVAVAVYDVANQVDSVTAVMDVQRFEATNNALEVRQLVTMRNDSRPPRTLMKDRSFEVDLPPEAEVESGLVQVEDGQPLKQRPIIGDPKGQYYFSFPLRPGDTRFGIVYRLPYDGSALVRPHLRNPFEKFVVMLPKDMKFDPKTVGIFHSMPNTTPDNVQGANAVTSEKSLAFRISGTGMLEELKGRRQEGEAQSTNTKATGAVNPPGGGLAPPIEAPDPLEKYRWSILAGLLMLTMIGATHVSRKTRETRVAENASLLRQVRTGSHRRSRQKTRRRERQRVQV
jgi:hypothetical protein